VINHFWNGFEKRAEGYKPYLIGAAAAPVVGAGLGVMKNPDRAPRAALMGAGAGTGLGIGVVSGKMIGDLLKGIAKKNPQELKGTMTLGKYMPAILGLIGAGLGAGKMLTWLAGLGSRDGEVVQTPTAEALTDTA